MTFQQDRVIMLLLPYYGTLEGCSPFPLYGDYHTGITTRDLFEWFVPEDGTAVPSPERLRSFNKYFGQKCYTPSLIAYPTRPLPLGSRHITCFTSFLEVQRGFMQSAFPLLVDFHRMRFCVRIICSVCVHVFVPHDINTYLIYIQASFINFMKTYGINKSRRRGGEKRGRTAGFE